MPILPNSTYEPPPFPFSCGHVQTILPSFFRQVAAPDNYEREEFRTPDDDILLLDWARVGSRRLLIISHGLCGHSYRHYVLLMVAAFNAAGWDCLAWNFRGTGGSPGIQPKFTTQASTYELDWVTRHALEAGHYEQVAYTGFSMGGNLTALYLGKDADRVPPQVRGAALFCATIDLLASHRKLHSFMGRHYVRYLAKDLVTMLQRKAREFPGAVDATGVEKMCTFEEIDDHFTAPYLGCRDHLEYYDIASASHHLHRLKVPLLLVAPQNDPFLAGGCFPRDEAARNPLLFLECPSSGGHCGFITPHHQVWWPARRALQFLTEHCLSPE